jgi:hypothetical protein
VRSDRRVLGALLGVAGAPGLAPVASGVRVETSHVVPGLDRWLETEIARAVARGDWLGGPLAHYESAPAWGLLMGPVYRVAGERWLGPLLVQAVLGALVPLLLYDVGRRLAAPRVGLLAGLLAAFYAPAIFYEGLTLKLSLVPFAVALLLFGTAAAAGARRWHGPAAVAGVAMALVVALRLNAIAALPVVAGSIVRARGCASGRALLLFGLGLLAVAAPLAARRSLAAARGEAASLWGIHFYVGTVAGGDGGYAVVPGVADDVFWHVDDARALAEAEAGRPLEPGEVSRYWLRRGLAAIRSRPGAYLALEMRKLGRLLDPGEDDAFGDDWGAYAARSPVLRWGLTFGSVTPLALLGLVLVMVRRPALGWCVGIALAYAGSLLLFFVTPRYRLPIVPPLLLCAALALAWVADLWATRRLGAAAAAAGLLFAGPVVVGAPRADLVRLLVTLAVGIPLARRAGQNPT